MDGVPLLSVTSPSPVGQFPPKPLGEAGGEAQYLVYQPVSPPPIYGSNSTLTLDRAGDDDRRRSTRARREGDPPDPPPLPLV